MRKLLIFCFVFGAIVGKGQQTASFAADSLAAFIRKVKNAYGKAAYLDFQVKYRYANAGHPGQYIDSLAGKVEMDRGRSRVVIDGMESVQTDRYSINILPDNRIIYLAAADHGASQNPVSNFDTLFARMGGVNTRVQTRDGEDMLTMDFPSGQAYTRIEMTVDAKTGLFRRVMYAVNTNGLVAADMIESAGNPAPYQSKGQIEILFSNYQRGHFDDRVFNEDNFFKKAAGKYQPADRFRNYQIYLASSNL